MTGWRGERLGCGDGKDGVTGGGDIMYKVGLGNLGGSIDRMGVVCARMSWLDRSKN